VSLRIRQELTKKTKFFQTGRKDSNMLLHTVHKRNREIAPHDLDCLQHCDGVGMNDMYQWVCIGVN
jgi:hypothetical protein